MISDTLRNRIDELLEKHQVEKKETTEGFQYIPRVQAIYDSLDGCDGMSPYHLETSVLGWFPCFQKFIFDRCTDNPSTFGGKTHINHPRGIEMIKTPHCDSDDQGFEGGWTHDDKGNIVFDRIVQDLIDEKNSEVVEN